MSSRKQQPKWWQVYVALPLLLGLFWPETHARLTRMDHILAELGILGLVFGFMRLWLQANRSALMSSETTEFGWGIRDSRIASQPPKVADEPERTLPKRLMLQIPSGSFRGAGGGPLQRENPELVSSEFGNLRTTWRKE